MKNKNALINKKYLSDVFFQAYLGGTLLAMLLGKLSQKNNNDLIRDKYLSNFFFKQ